MKFKLPEITSKGLIMWQNLSPHLIIDIYERPQVLILNEKVELRSECHFKQKAEGSTFIYGVWLYFLTYFICSQNARRGNFFLAC